MNDETRENSDVERDEETMAELLRLAGPRSPIPPDVESRVYESVQKEWRDAVQQPDSARVYARVHRQWQKSAPKPRFTRWAIPVALAATLVMAIAVVLQQPPVPVPVSVPVGTIARVQGAGSSGALAAAGRLVFPGESLTTEAGQGMSVLLNNAESLRIDEQTTLIVDASDEFTLVQGRVYVDTVNFMYRNHGLVIETPLGSVTDIGTQFSVSLADDAIDVAVREGRVDINQESETFVAVAGERLRLHRTDGATVDALSAHDAYWNWTTELAPAFELENKSLLDFLRWAARETGRELVFESNELRLSAMRTDLHGSVSDFDPTEAVESVLATTNYRYRIEADRIVILQ